MVELNSARIIREARQTKPYCPLTFAELGFIKSHPNLTDGEKIVWITIAEQSTFDEYCSCTISQGQIAKMVCKSIVSVTRIIKRLREKEFLQSESTSFGALTYFLTLPQAGLEVILDTANRKMAGGTEFKTVKNDTSPSITNDRPPLSRMIDPSITNDRPPLSSVIDIYNINNNNINNINHNHNSYSDFSPVDNLAPQTPVLDADALIYDFNKLIQEKYQHLIVPKRLRAARSHFSTAQLRIIDERLLALAVIDGGQKIQAAQAQAAQFTQKLAEATPVPESRPQPKNCKLVEFENEHFLVVDSVKDKILNEIPRLYQQKQIKGDAGQKPLNTLLKEILYYVTKSGSMGLDACQLQRFYIARKLCQKGAWERPNGLERQDSIYREQQWQQAKIAENKFAKEFTKGFTQKLMTNFA